jgi:hypothetical protein
MRGCRRVGEMRGGRVAGKKGGGEEGRHTDFRLDGRLVEGLDDALDLLDRAIGLEVAADKESASGLADLLCVSQAARALPSFSRRKQTIVNVCVICDGVTLLVKGCCCCVIVGGNDGLICRGNAGLAKPSQLTDRIARLPCPKRRTRARRCSASEVFPQPNDFVTE